MEKERPDIRIAAPDANSPGFLEWAGDLAEVIEVMGSGKTPTPENVGGYLRAVVSLRNVLLHFVVEPSDPDEARAALNALSLNELTDILGTLQEAFGGAAPSPKASLSYADGSANRRGASPLKSSSSRRRASGASHRGK